MADKYIYAVARIRALEMSLFSQAVIEQLIAQKTYADCLQFLGEKGWGDTEAGVRDAETILNRELEKHGHWSRRWYPIRQYLTYC